MVPSGQPQSDGLRTSLASCVQYIGLSSAQEASGVPSAHATTHSVPEKAVPSGQPHSEGALIISPSELQ